MVEASTARLKEVETMAKGELPAHYRELRRKHRSFFDALDNLGETLREAGPLPPKLGHLVRLAAAAAIRSEGAVHSHVRRALEAGATEEEIEHTLLMLTATVGFPTVAAALSWMRDVVERR